MENGKCQEFFSGKSIFLKTGWFLGGKKARCPTAPDFSEERGRKMKKN
jgi:hypothetical protein